MLCWQKSDLSLTEEEQQEVFAGFLTVYDEVILPSLSLMPHNCCLSEEVWGFVRLLKYEHRSVVLIVTFSQVLLTVFTTPFSLNRFAVVMVALWNKADHYIFILWFLSFYLLFFSSPNLSSCTLDVCHTSTHGLPYCEFRMQVWNVLHAARWKYRMQKSHQKSPSRHHRTTLSG